MNKIYAYDNPYSRQRISTKDIKTTRRIKTKYNRVVFFEKLFAGVPAGRVGMVVMLVEPF